MANVIQPVNPDQPIPNEQSVPLSPQPVVMSPNVSVAPAVVQPTAEPAQPPVVPTGNQSFPIGVSASQLGLSDKPKMPKGIYLIVAYSVVGAIFAFMNQNSDTTLYSIAMVIDLLLAFGLLSRLDIARKAMIWLLALTVVASIVAVFGLMAVQSRLSDLQTKTHQVFEEAKEKNNSTRVVSQLESTIKSLDDKKAEVDRQYGRIYMTYAINVIAVAGVIFYLTRPHVKDAFRTD